MSLNLIFQILSILAPVFIISSIGYFWRISRGGVNTAQITDIVALIGAPCLIFNTLANLKISQENLNTMFFAASSTILITLIVSIIVLTLIKLPWKIFAPPLTFTNSGNVGISVCLFAFGQKGLELGVLYFAIIATIHFTIGICIWSESIKLINIFKTPLIYSVILGLFVFNSNIHVPEFLLKTTKILGGLTIPLMLFSLGISLADLRIIPSKKTIVLTFLRFLIGITVTLTLISLLKFNNEVKNILLLQSVLPIAVFNYLFAYRYKKNPEEIASLILSSVIFSMLALPIMLAIIL